MHTGYKLVWQELFRCYSQAHVISRCCEKCLLKVSKISQHDVNGLENLVILLKRCQASPMINKEPSGELFRCASPKASYLRPT